MLDYITGRGGVPAPGRTRGRPSPYKGFPLIRDFPLQGISPYKGFPLVMDFPVHGISLYMGFPFTLSSPAAAERAPGGGRTFAPPVSPVQKLRGSPVQKLKFHPRLQFHICKSLEFHPCKSLSLLLHDIEGDK